MKYLAKLLSTYDYNSIRELILSMFPSWKYQLQTLSFFLSAFASVVDYLFGFGPTIVLAMVVAVLVEVTSGIKASKKQGYEFESLKFSRCVLKLCLWLAIFYIVHAFVRHFSESREAMDTLAYLGFQSLFVGALFMFVVEHVTSILENLAVLNNKPKTQYIKVIQVIWSSFLDNIKNKLS